MEGILEIFVNGYPNWLKTPLCPPSPLLPAPPSQPCSPSPYPQKPHPHFPTLPAPPPLFRIIVYSVTT